MEAGLMRNTSEIKLDKNKINESIKLPKTIIQKIVPPSLLRVIYSFKNI